MKNLLIGLCFLGFTSSMFAQKELLFKGTLKKEQVPTVVLEAIDVDFPGFVMNEIVAVPIEYVENDVYINNDVDFDDIETYQMSLEGKGKVITATYNNSGKLLSTIENLKNVKPPLEVTKSLIQAYPGWAISSDSYHMSHYANGKEKERYRFVMSKDGKKEHVYTDAHGKILSGAHKMK